MRFLVDAQLPPILAVWLCKNGHEAQHVQDIGLRDATDAAIRDYAGRIGGVLITKDRDFLPAKEMRSAAPQVIWVRTGNLGTQHLIARLETALPQLLAHLHEGAPLVELR